MLSRLCVERPPYAEFQGTLRADISRCAEVIRRIVRPAHADIDHLDEYASPLPLDIDERIDVRAISEFFAGLIVALSGGRLIGRSVPFCSIGNVSANLHPHYFRTYDVELHIPSRIEGQFR